jgi:2',3'-cyclic-nucleotide 2'-phosphodiesterase (5'-nucleotidase family)
MLSLLVSLGIGVWFFHRAMVRKRNPVAAAITGIVAYYFVYLFVDWSFRLIYGGTVHHYERYADGTVEGTAILAGGMAAIALGFVVLHGEREGGDKT